MCLFCKIVEKEIPANIELENEDCLAFHDINPKAPIHILVIPKKHIDSFNDIDPETMAKLTPFMQDVAKQLGIDQTGYRVITNVGSDGGQEVKHLHFHILGGAKLQWGHFTDADPREYL